jgi:primosomal replication protein N
MATIKIRQADGTVVTVVLGHNANAVTVKVGDAVKIEGFKTPMDANTVMATSFTGSDGKAVAVRDLDDKGGPRGIQGESVSVSGIVTEVMPATTTPSTGDTGRLAREAMATIKVKQADDTIVTVVLGREASSIAVKVGDVVKVEGFKMPVDTNTIMATSFTGADGTKIAIAAGGFRGGCGMRGGQGDGQGAGRGFRGGMMGPDSCPDTSAPSGT